MSADADRRLPFSYASHLLCYPYCAFTEGAAEAGNGGTLRPVFCRAVSACSLASGQKIWVPSSVSRLGSQAHFQQITHSSFKLF